MGEGQVSPAALSPPAWRGYAHQEEPLRRAPGTAEAHAHRPGPRSRPSSVLPPAARPAPFCRLGAARCGLAGRPFCEARGGAGGGGGGEWRSSCSTAGAAALWSQRRRGRAVRGSPRPPPPFVRQIPSLFLLVSFFATKSVVPLEHLVDADLLSKIHPRTKQSDKGD